MKVMKTYVLVSLCLVLVSCATLRRADHSINWPVILSDAQFGISAACSQEWLNATDCTIATDAITTTQAAIAKAPPSEIKGDVHVTLGAIVAKLPAGSKVTDFLLYVVALSA
jgi:hypothetical protein